MTPTSNPSGFRITGWHVLAAFVVFFGLTFAVDGVMIADAYQTYPGEVADNPYEVGLTFDSTLAQRQAQAALGWRMTEALATPQRIEAAVMTRDGGPVTGLRMVGTAERPTTESGKRALTFRERSPGVYEADTPALGGAWDVKITAHDRQGREFDAERRLVGP